MSKAVSRSTNGYLQINNDPILWTMLNSVKEQQAQIEQQKALIESQQKRIKEQDERDKLQQVQIDALKKLVCLQNSTAEICREE